MVRLPASRRLRWIGAMMLFASAFLILLIAAANWWICRTTSSRIINDPARLPAGNVGLVLGTSKYAGDGTSSNPFFTGRIDTAARLFLSGRVRHLLVSGDNDRKTYDEPTWMRDALIARGVPAEAITLDYAGFRTLDSVVRAGSVFGLERFTIITDDFHQPRSLFLARSRGLDVVGFPSDHVPWIWSKKTRIREWISRCRACLDVYVLHTSPKFFGPHVEIPVAAVR